MTEEKDNYLVEKYPKIFQNRYGDMRETAMCWGFEHNDGWFWLIDNLCGTIQSYIDNNSKKKRIKNKYIRFINQYLWKKTFRLSNKNYLYKISKVILNFIRENCEEETYESIPQVIATQVKEKFGGLRFYIDGGDEKIDGMIWLAEHESYNICEFCGSTQNVGHTKGWIYTICYDCYDNSTEDRFKNLKWKSNE